MELSIFAPASIGNVGVGFDVLGAAVSPIDNTLLGDIVHIKQCNVKFKLNLTGSFKDQLPKNNQENLAYICWQEFTKELKKLGIDTLNLELTLEKNMPIGSGLGSSACSVVACLDALNQFHNNPLSKNELLTMMGKMEGLVSGSIHFDNVAPAYLGGLQFILNQDNIVSQNIPCFDNWYWVMAYPGIKIATAQMRAILPENYAKSDIIEHGKNLGGFIHACYTKQPQLAANLMCDVIAEPYRAKLIPGFINARDHLNKNGALATSISGSGPTLMSICDDLEIAKQNAAWLQANYLQNDNGFVHICKLDINGSRQL